MSEFDIKGPNAALTEKIERQKVHFIVKQVDQHQARTLIEQKKSKPYGRKANPAFFNGVSSRGFSETHAHRRAVETSVVSQGNQGQKSGGGNRTGSGGANLRQRDCRGGSGARTPFI